MSLSTLDPQSRSLQVPPRMHLPPNPWAVREKRQHHPETMILGGRPAGNCRHPVNWLGGPLRLYWHLGCDGSSRVIYRWRIQLSR
jgi:hypothetical protein